MRKILAFAGSNSSTSIHQQLVSSVASKLNDYEVKTILLTDFPLPMYSEDIEKTEGFPSQLSLLLTEIKQADGLLIAVNEHNGTVSAFFKNVLDWLSRIEKNFLAGKKVLLMTTSPGKRGGLTAHQYLEGILPRLGGELVNGFTFPSFYDNFSSETGITNEELKTTVDLALAKFSQALD